MYYEVIVIDNRLIFYFQKEIMILKKAMTVSVICLFSTFVLAQNECHYTLKGKVRELQTGTAAAYTQVYIRENSLSAVCDEYGNFTIKNLCRQTYTLDFSHIECKKHSQILKVEGNTEGVFELMHDDKLLESVVVSEKKVALEQTQTVGHLATEDLRKKQGATLADMLEGVSGLSSLRTGANVAKPVLQGLHSDRVLIVTNGVRQESQAWGQEHAPEIDPFIADRVEVVKGAAGVRYGIGALGGVVLIEPRPLRDTLGAGGAVTLVGMQNGRGGAFSGYFEQRPSQKIAWRIQATAKKMGILSTPQYRLENTGVEELNGSATLIFKGKKLKNELFFSSFYTKIGIFKGSHIGNLTDLKAAIARSEPLVQPDFYYKIARPAQILSHQTLKYKSVLPLESVGRLTFVANTQYDLRKEFDAHRPGGRVLTGFDRAEIAFEMPSANAKLDFEHRNIQNWVGGAGIETNFTYNNTFSGGLIPDYKQYGAGIYAVERWRKDGSALELEGGIRYDLRHIAVDSTRFGEKNRQFDFKGISASGGILWHFDAHGKVNVNFSTAFRNPNVNELFSNGVHHGTASFERGNPNMGIERAFSGNIGVHHDGEKWEFDASIFVNRINGFIFLAPDSAPVLTIRGAFPAFNYLQTDAILRGGDFSAVWHIASFLRWRGKASTVRAYNISTADWLPLMPADRIENELRIENEHFKKLKNTYLSVNVQNVFRQKRVPVYLPDYAPAPKSYTLVGMSIGYSRHFFGKETTMSVNVSNLLNQRYRDYTDRLRYFSDAIGRNIGVNMTMIF